MIDGVTQYRESQARTRVNALKTGIPLRRYVEGMARRGEILKNSEAVIIEAVTRPAPQGPPRNPFEHLGVPGPERPAPLPGGSSHADLIARCQAFLDGPGSGYLNPRHQPDPDELPMVAVARRFGMNKEDAEQFYISNAVKLAGRTGASLAQGVFNALTTVADGKYLGVEARDDNPPPEPTPAPPPELTPPPAGGLMIAGQYFQLPQPQAPAAEPATAGSRLLDAVRGGF